MTETESLTTEAGSPVRAQVQFRTLAAVAQRTRQDDTASRPASVAARGGGGDRQAELAEIIRAYNEVTERLQQSHEHLQAEVVRLREELASTNAQLQRSRRLSALGEMAAGIAHEIRNPLAAIQLYANMAKEDVTAADSTAAAPGDAASPVLEPARQNLQKIASAVSGLNTIVNDVLSFARELEPSPQPIDVTEQFDRALEAHQPAIEQAGIAIDRRDRQREDGHTGQTLHADPNLLQQALVNLVRNAVDAMHDQRNTEENASIQDQAGDASAHEQAGNASTHEQAGTERSSPQGEGRGVPDARDCRGGPGSDGDIDAPNAATAARLRLDADADAQGVTLTVRDTGPGIADSDIDRIFNPFFTTRGAGTGLGLAIVHRIVDAHGGTVSVYNDGGAVFQLSLPLTDSR